MSDYYVSDYATDPNQFGSRSPSSERSERHSQLVRRYSSAEDNSPPSSAQSLPKASKIIEVLQKNSKVLSKDHRNSSKHVNHSKNEHHQHNSIANEVKGKGKEVQLKKSKNSDSPRYDHSYEDFYSAESRQERFADDFFKKNGQYSSDFKGRAEERRTPVEPKKTKKDSGEKGEYYQREERRKNSSQHLDVSGEEFLKSLAREKYKDHVDYFDISETTSEIWYADESTRSQNISMKSKSTKKNQSGLKDKDLNDLIRELTTQSKNSRKDHDEYSQKKSVEDVRKKGNQKEIDSRRETNKGKNEEYLRLMEKLNKFPLNELRITKKGNLDMRSKVTDSYLNLCEKVSQDPMEFYDKNYHKWEKKNVRKEEASDEEGEFQKDLNELKRENKGNIELKGRTESRNIRQSNHKEKEVLRATHAETLNRSDDSDELSYKGSESDDDEEMKKRALEELEKFNYASIRVTREGRMSEKYPEEKADLYFKFCKDADVHPIQYYRETGKKNVSKENLEERIKTLLENDGYEIDDLVFTKQGLPSKRVTSREIKNWLVKYGYYD